MCSGWIDAAVVAFVCPVHQLTALEPQLDLPLGPLHGVAGVDDVPVPGGRGRTQASVCTLGVPGTVCCVHLGGPRDSLLMPYCLGEQAG